MALLIVNLLIPLVLGGLSGFAIREHVILYKALIQPPLAPPSWVFPVVWTLLYILMGIAAYRVCRSRAPERIKKEALTLYAIQLVVNILWPILFFNLEAFLFAFLWLVLLVALIIVTMSRFSRIDKGAEWLLVPYLAWTAFAGYLNLSIYLLNR